MRNNIYVHNTIIELLYRMLRFIYRLTKYYDSMNGKGALYFPC